MGERRGPEVGRFELLALVVLGMAVASRDLHAYLDPGTGSYLFQITAAAGFTALFVLKRCWHQVRSRFRRPAGDGPSGNGDSNGRDARGG